MNGQRSGQIISQLYPRGAYYKCKTGLNMKYRDKYDFGMGTIKKELYGQHNDESKSSTANVMFIYSESNKSTADADADAYGIKQQKIFR